MRHPILIPLSNDHHHGLALALRCRRQALGQIKPTGAQGLKERVKEYRDFFVQNLVPHFRAEEEILFPLIRARAAESHSLIDQLLKDHEQLRKGEECLAEDKGLSKVLFDLGDLLERHIRREERELFPFFENLAALIDAERIGKEIKEILENRERSR